MKAQEILQDQYKVIGMFYPGGDEKEGLMTALNREMKNQNNNKNYNVLVQEQLDYIKGIIRQLDDTTVEIVGQEKNQKVELGELFPRAFCNIYNSLDILNAMNQK